MYEAEHPVHGLVALKLPRDELGRNPTLRRMFENEVQMTTALSHPQIVGALGGYPTGAGAHLALEYCDTTLSAFAAQPLPLGRACRLVLDVAQGLAHSHTRRILHRDVKPANVFVLAERAKLGDFGTGFYLSSAFSGEAPTARVGTAFYMAPELFRGQSATPQSDLYSLGVTAYEVIAGVRPFTGVDEDALMLAHTSEVPLSLRHHRAEVSAELNRAVATAMSYDPNKRFESVQDFVLAFAGATGLPAAPASEQPLGRSSRAKLTPDADKKGTKGRFGWFGRKRS